MPDMVYVLVQESTGHGDDVMFPPEVSVLRAFDTYSGALASAEILNAGAETGVTYYVIDVDFYKKEA